MTKEKDQKALAIINNEIFNLQAIAEGSAEVQENLDQINIHLPQIRIIHQAQLFEMPDGNKLAEFQGVILDFNKINSYWAESFDKSGGGTPPDCFSLDGITPSPLGGSVQSEFCASCPQNSFGSDGGRGKNCKNLERLHVITQTNQLLPYRITLPPSNLKAFYGYISSLVAKGYPWRMVYTNFALKKVQNKDGIAYAELVLTPVSVIPKDQVAISKEISKRLMPYLRDEVRREDYATE